MKVKYLSMVGARSFRQLFQKAIGNENAKDVRIVAQRIIEVFNEHGVETTQIPRFFPDLNLENLATTEKLIAAATPEIIDKIAQLFGIRNQWIEGVDDQIYDYLGTYKAPESLLQHLVQLDYPPGEREHFPLRVLTTRKLLDRTANTDQLLAPILVEPIAELGDETIYRYHIFRDGFDWTHTPCRIELKAIARIVFTKLHTPVPLFVISPEEMGLILEGKIVPRTLFHGGLLTNPSLEDYAIPSNGSHIPKETDEFAEVVAYIERLGLNDIQFPSEFDEEAPSQISDTIAAEENTTANDNGKRSVRDALWADVLVAARTIWAQEPTLPIAEVVRRLMRMPNLEATRFESNTIHKRIAQVAPEGIRGKSGRKPKQSTSMLSSMIQQNIRK